MKGCNTLVTYLVTGTCNGSNLSLRISAGRFHSYCYNCYKVLV